MQKFPFDVWGKVISSSSTDVGKVEMVKITRCPGGGFLFITREDSAEYDVWIETFEEVEDDLEAFRIEWLP